MIKRVFCLILFLTFVMIPKSIGATSHPLPSGRLTGEELAIEYAQEGQISVERAKIILSYLILSYLSACQILSQGLIEFSLKRLSSILTMMLESSFTVEQMKVDNLEES